MAQAGKPVYLIANWKSHKTWAETEVYLSSFRGFREEGRVVNIICPPFPYLKPASDLIKSLHLPIKLGAQDISPFPFGAYTGAVSAGMLASLVDYVIVGHSERRRYFHETDIDVASKVKELSEVGLKPVICLDEPYLESQLSALNGSALSDTLFAYEPLSAIGSGSPDTPEHADEIAKQVQTITSASVSVLYGGSVTSENLAAYLHAPLIQGALVGGASLNLESWKAILNVAKDF